MDLDKLRRHIGQQVKALRHARDWTVRELADRADLTQGYVCNVELARPKNFSLQTLNKIAVALNVPLRELLPP